MTENQIKEETPISHFAMIPHIVDDMNLSPYEYRLYGHFKRVTGENGGKCWQSTQTIAKICGMSPAMVSKTKKSLKQKGLIRIKTVAGEPGRDRHIITIIDIWKANHEHFQSSPSKGQSSQDKLQSSPDEPKNNPSEEKPSSLTPAAVGDQPDAGESFTPVKFEDWLEQIRQSKNMQAVVRRMIVTLMPNNGKPDYGRVAKTAKQVGSYGRLAQLVWQAASLRPTGDVLSYCLGIAKNGFKQASEPSRAQVVERDGQKVTVIK